MRALVASSLVFVAIHLEGGEPPALRAGSDAVDLEADDSMVIAGGIGPGRAEGQEGKLRCVATAIEGPGPGGSGRTRLAIVACDILMLARDYTDAAARRIESELGIPFENVLVSSTHTHHAPSTVTIHGYERDEKFCAAVRDGIVEAARRALARLEAPGSESQLLFRLGEESSVGRNSRLLLSDGTIYWTGDRSDAVRPTGPFDPELPVLAFRSARGYEAVLFNHSTHAIGALSPGKRSPAFYGMAAQELETELGGTVTFISGAFGSTHNLDLAPREMVYRIREAVREALRAARPLPVAELRSAKRPFRYRVRKFDEEAEDAAVSAYVKKRLGGSPDYVVGVFRKMRSELAPRQGEERETWIQALRIGEIAWVALPGEAFTRIGVEIKRRSPFRYTYVAGVANDYIGYIPDARAFELGGYQVWTGFHSFVEKGTGEALVEAAVALLEEIRR